MPVVDQIEAAYREFNDHGYCCPDCDPNHPANTLNAALEEIEAYRAGLADSR